MIGPTASAPQLRVRTGHGRAEPPPA